MLFFYVISVIASISFYWYYILKLIEKDVKDSIYWLEKSEKDYDIEELKKREFEGYKPTLNALTLMSFVPIINLILVVVIMFSEMELFKNSIVYNIIPKLFYKILDGVRIEKDEK